MNFGLIIVGDEILSGKRQDKHFAKVVELLGARGLQLAWARVLGSVARSDEQVALVRGLLDGTSEVPGLAVDTDLRWHLLLRLVAIGIAGDAEIDAELAGEHRQLVDQCDVDVSERVLQELHQLGFGGRADRHRLVDECREESVDCGE